MAPFTIGSYICTTIYIFIRLFFTLGAVLPLYIRSILCFYTDELTMYFLCVFPILDRISKLFSTCRHLCYVFDANKKQKFPGHGCYDGKVVGFYGKKGLYSVFYEDGDREQLSESEICKYVVNDSNDQEHLVQQPSGTHDSSKSNISSNKKTATSSKLVKYHERVYAPGLAVSKVT
jgi:hypothetical protein